MGKGVIISGGSGGLYSVKVEYSAGNLAYRLLQLDELISLMDNLIDGIEADIDIVNGEMTDIINEMFDMQIPLTNYRYEIEELRETIDDLTEEIEVLEADLQESQEEKAKQEQNLLRLLDNLDDVQNLIDEELEKEFPDLELVAQLEEQQGVIEDSIATAESSIAYHTSMIDYYEESISTESGLLAVAQTSFNETQALVSDIVKQVEVKEADLQKLQLKYQGYDIKRKAYTAQKLSHTKMKAYLTSVSLEKTISCYCADLTEDLEADTEIGMIEVPNESQFFNIYPAYNKTAAAYDVTRDGQLMLTTLMSPAQLFYNLAMLPGVQKWKPLYRYARIDSITSGKATITLENYKSSQQDIEINQESTISDVEFEYMSCNDSAFKVGDIALIKFTGQNFEAPKIIGFKEEPRACSFFIKVSSINETIFDGFSGWDIRLTQPINEYIDEKGGYTENYTVISEAIRLDSKGVAEINYGDLLKEIDPEYDLNVWLRKTTRMMYFTLDVKGDYPDLLGSYMLPELFIMSQAGWDAIPQATKDNADYQADRVWGQVLADEAGVRTDIFSIDETTFTDALDEERSGYVVAFENVKNIQLYSEWEQVTPNVPNWIAEDPDENASQSHSYTTEYASFVAAYSGLWFPGYPQYQSWVGSMVFEYQDVDDVSAGPCMIPVYTYYYTPTPHNAIENTLVKCGSFIETDRYGLNPEYTAGYREINGENGGIWSRLIIKEEGECDGVNYAPGDPYGGTSATGLVSTVYSGINWTMQDITRF